MKTGVALFAFLLVVAISGANVCALQPGLEQAKDQAGRNEQELKTKTDRSMMDLKSLEQAVTAHYVVNRSYPESLQQLSKPDKNGRPAMIKESLLTDPWGRLYQYEPDKRHPKTDNPLIYTQGPDPTERNSKISNWDLSDKKK